METWARAQAIEGMQVEVVRLEGRTPLIFIEIPATGAESGDDTVLLYGHLDKQPEMTGWDADLGPWEPVLRDDKLYGRGGADDGYAIFGLLAAVLALRTQGLPHARCVVLIEACENPAATTCRPTSTIWPHASASHRWWCAWIRAAATMSSCGAPPRCAG